MKNDNVADAASLESWFNIDAVKGNVRRSGKEEAISIRVDGVGHQSGRKLGMERAMHASAVYTAYESCRKAKGWATAKYRVAKLAKLLSMDADPIFKSKEWPHLWPK